MCCRLPSGSVQPTTTNSSRFKHFDLTHIPRSPGAYGRSTRFDITPSRFHLAGVLAKARAVANNVVAEAQTPDLFR